MSRRRPTPCAAAPVVIPIVRLWVLRLLVPLGLHREFIMKHDFSSDTLAEALDLQECQARRNLILSPSARRCVKPMTRWKRRPGSSARIDFAPSAPSPRW